MLDIDSRFKDAPWYLRCKDEFIMVVGCGGIGSNALYYLTKTIPAKYLIIDNDIVEDVNVGCQFFSKTDIELSKVAALSARFGQMSNAIITTFQGLYDGSTTTPIMISGLDNMATRKQIYEAWKLREDRELLLDGRLRANYYEIFAVTKDRESEYEETLFEDSKVSDGPCTFKQTAYFGGLIGARITHLLVNYLTNKYSEDPINVLPFTIKEFGDFMNIEIKL